MTKKEYQEKVNSLMVKLIGTDVEHMSYGKGRVKSLEEGLVNVKFEDNSEIKAFQKSTFFVFNDPLDEDLKAEFEALKCEYELSIKNDSKKPTDSSFKQVVRDPNRVTFDDVIGLEDVKEEINRLIVYPFKYDEIYRAFNRQAGGGILLYGVPGCGKTMIVKAIANEVNARLFTVKCSDIKSKWYGESEGKIKELFNQARGYYKSIIFFDEFDSLGVNRDGENCKYDKSLVAELLTQIDGFDSKKSGSTLLVIAATNKPWNIDSALLRNGRFGKKIFVGLPTQESIIAIMQKELSGLPIEDILYDDVVSNISNLSSADVVALCNEAKDIAIKRSILNQCISPIKTSDLLSAKEIVKSSVNEDELKKLKSFRV